MQRCRWQDDLVYLAGEVLPELAKLQGIHLEIGKPLVHATEEETYLTQHSLYYKLAVDGSQEDILKKLGYRKAMMDFCSSSFFAAWLIVSQYYLLTVSVGFYGEEILFQDGLSPDHAGLLEPYPLQHRMNKKKSQIRVVISQ